VGRGFESSCPCQTESTKPRGLVLSVWQGQELQRNRAQALLDRGEFCGFACKMTAFSRQANSLQVCQRHTKFGSESSATNHFLFRAIS